MGPFLQFVNKVFQQSGDCYGETITEVLWDTLNFTEPYMREQDAYYVVVKMTPSGSGYLWIKHKDDGCYIGWETEHAVHKLDSDQLVDMAISCHDFLISSNNK